jgi:hypothetical protein
VKHRKTADARIFVNEIDQKLYNLISSICRNIYVVGEENKDKMMQLCQKWLKSPKLFISEEKYQKQYDLKIEKRKQDPKLKMPDTFETYNKKQHILIATLSVLITVQTAVPEMTIKRTFPGCVKSFSGYPLKDGQDDLSSVHYMACVLKKMYANNKEEQALLPKKESDLAKLFVDTLKDVILLQADIVHLYDVKRQCVGVASHGIAAVMRGRDQDAPDRVKKRGWPTKALDQRQTIILCHNTSSKSPTRSLSWPGSGSCSSPADGSCRICSVRP